MAQLLRIRLANDVLWCEVTEGQWLKFLHSLDRTSRTMNIPLTKTTGAGVKSDSRGSIRNGTLEQQETRGREQRNVAG